MIKVENLRKVYKVGGEKVVALDNRYMTLEYNDSYYYFKKLN